MATRTRPKLATLKARQGRVGQAQLSPSVSLTPHILRAMLTVTGPAFSPPAKTDFGDRYVAKEAEAATKPYRQKPT